MARSPTLRELMNSVESIFTALVGIWTRPRSIIFLPVTLSLQLLGYLKNAHHISNFCKILWINSSKLWTYSWPQSEYVKDLLWLNTHFSNKFLRKSFQSAFIHSYHLHHEIIFSRDFLKKISISQETLRIFQNRFSPSQVLSQFSMEKVIFSRFSKEVSHLSQRSKSIFKCFKAKILRISISLSFEFSLLQRVFQWILTSSSKESFQSPSFPEKCFPWQVFIFPSRCTYHFLRDFQTIHDFPTSLWTFSRFPILLHLSFPEKLISHHLSLRTIFQLQSMFSKHASCFSNLHFP